MLPLREIGAWTSQFRRGKAAQHDRRAAREAAAGDAAWEAAGRRGVPAVAQRKAGPWAPEVAPWGELAPGGRSFRLEGAELVRVDNAAAGSSLGTQRAGASFDASTRIVGRGDMRREIPSWDCTTHVERVRKRWKDLGRGRRKHVTHRERVPSYVAHESGRKWHAARADGQRHRSEHVESCGVGRIEVSCAACGVAHESPAYCGVVRLCPGCNVRRSMRMRRRFAVSLDIVLENAERAGSFHPLRPGGALGQKLVALTMPHVVEPEREPVEGAWGVVRQVRELDPGYWAEAARKVTTRRRIDSLFGAWSRFAARLQKWLREPWTGLRTEQVGACWHRAFEWTCGTDGMGHPHLHLWLLTPWIPERDDHRIESIAGGKRRPTTPCAAPHRIKGAWGWAETMRRERCDLCVARDAAETPAARLDRYYAAPRAWWNKKPAVERRTGLRSWWADSCAAEGAQVDSERANLSLRKGYAHAVQQFREIQKPNGVTYRERRTRRVEIRTSAGEMIDYFEGWCVAFVDERTWELAGPAVIAGVAEALEGKRLSQSSKVLLRTRKGGTVRVGFLGIADTFKDGSCRDCDDVAAREGKDAGPAPKRTIRVTTWQRLRAARVAAPLPPKTGPPPPAPPELGPEARHAALVKRLQAEARLEGGEIARMLDVCETIRLEGPDVLPVYARRGRRAWPSAPTTMRARFKRALRQLRTR